jgi:hypothetical protein
MTIASRLSRRLIARRCSIGKVLVILASTGYLLWLRRHLRDIVNHARDDFFDLLRDTRSLTSQTPTSGPVFDNLKTVMKKDPRFARLDEASDVRDQYMIEYITKRAPAPEVRAQEQQQQQVEKRRAAAAAEHDPFE